MEPMQSPDRGERLVGRTAELALFERLLAGVRDRNSGALVSLTGDPGIGKTTLVRSVVDRSRELGFRTVERTCWPGHGVPALWVWDAVLRDLGVLPEELDTGTQVDRFDAMLRALADAAEQQPLVLAVEDLHVGDVDTALFVRFLGRAIARLPIVLVASWRSGPGVTDLHRSIAAESTNRVHLGALPSAAVADILRRYPALDEDGRARCQGACGGNPLFIHELAQAMSAGDKRIPPSVREVIEHRLSSVEPGVRQVLLAAAVLGARSFVGEVALVAAMPNATVADVGLVSAGMVTIENLEVAFQHDLVREVLLATTPQRDLLLLHRRAVDMLTPAQSTQSAHRLAEHAAAVGVESVDDAMFAVRACSDAAERSRREGGLHRAADLLALAIRVRAAHPRLGHDPVLLVQHAEAVLSTGRLTDARTLFDLAVEAAESAGDIAVLARAAVGLGGVWVEEARDAPARERLLRLLRRSAEQLPESENVLRARVAIREAAELRYQGEASAEDVAFAVERLRPLDDDHALAEALSVLHHVLLTPPFATERLAVARELIEVSIRSGDELHAVVGRCWLTVDLYLLGDAGADRALEDFRAHAAALGCHSMDYIVAVLDVMRALRDGRLEEVEELSAAAHELGTAVGDADAFAYYGGQLMGLRWVQGRVGEIRDMIDELADSAMLRTHDMVFAAAAAAAAALDGEADTADRWIQGTGIGSAAAVPMFSTWSTSMLALTETAAALQDVELAEELLALVEPFAELPVRASLAITCLGPTRRLVGLLQVTAGRIHAGIDTLREAIDDCRRLRNRPVDAILQAELAAALLRRGAPGDASDARSLLERALAEGHSMGLTGRVPGWEELLDSIGDIRSPPSPADQPTGLVERLDSQWRVVVDDRELWLRDSVGMQHITNLLAAPGRLFSATEMSIATGGPVEDWQGEPLLDETARTAYAERLNELETDLQRAIDDADNGWIERLSAERDQLAHHLATATGLHGRTRSSADARERARTRVTKAIRRVIRRIEDAEPMLGRELGRTIQTGHVCGYSPDPVNPRRWEIRRQR